MKVFKTMKFDVYNYSTGIFIPLTPGHIFSVASFQVLQGLTGEIFWSVLDNRYALFTLGTESPF